MPPVRSAFSWRRFSRRNDANRHATPRIDHNQEPSRGILADRDEAFFLRMLVLNRDSPIITEGCDRISELDAVLPRVGGRLPRIPLICTHEYMYTRALDQATIARFTVDRPHA